MQDTNRAVTRTLIGGGGGCIFIYSGSDQLTSFEINFISKETSRAEPEYMNIHPPPPISTLATPLDTKVMLKDKFHMKDMGRLSYFLDIHFNQNDGYVKMNQRMYLTKLLVRFEMSDCKPLSTPSEQSVEWNGEDFVDPRKYRELVGSLIYAMTYTRPDTCWIVTTLSQYLSNLSKDIGLRLSMYCAT